MNAQGIELNHYFASLVKMSSTFSLVTEPSFALSVFRLAPSSMIASNSKFAEEQLNELNRAFYGRISARPDILLTQTKLNGIFCLRFAIGAASTKKEHIDSAWALLEEEARGTLSDWSRK